ncbi:MAG: VWA domain-containing protein [Acidobacteria bacterium 13_1_20CM_3_58_11]|nr:MAG: VWA domain-containing protein [Acidobacteria bacterium 13_1_20CM_3_58_11]
MPLPGKIFSIFTVAGLLLQAAAPVIAQQSGQAGINEARIRVSSELVLVNVVAHDKKGNLVRDLKKGDFTLLEDGKKQEIATFDFENVDELATAGPAEAAVSGVAGGALLSARKQAEPSLDARDRRLILLFFDFSAMDPEQIDRSVDAAKKFVDTKMQPADLMALVSLATNMRVDLDFTDDKTKLRAALTAFHSGQGQGFDNGVTGSAEGAAETSGAFSADDTDFNTFNADRKLLALQSLMQALGKLPQKKSLIYFSNGISQSGADNQSALRATTAAAVKANVSIYSLDIRGLQAFPPGGEAQAASLHGQSAYSGQSVLNDLSGNAASQETLATLSSDTGGKAFFDSNDFGGVFSQVQKDSSAYYVLGFTSNNPLKDGRFRRLKVQVNRTDLKLDFRAGYYAGRDFEHLNRADREQQLVDELDTQLPRVDVPLYAGAAYFRQDDAHYYLAVALVIPGSQIPFVTEKEKDNATIDIIGEALEGGKLRVGQLRDTVKLAVESTQQVRRKNVQYNTGFVLAPGSYHLKFIVRENQSGRMGSFETDVQIPDLRKTPLKMSSVVLSSLRAPVANKKNGANPLVRDQLELVPNITHVFAPDQHLYLQYEVYDAAKGKNPAPLGANVQNRTAKDAPAAKPAKDSIRVFTNIEFLQGATKIYESKPVVANEVTALDRKAVIFQMDLPLEALKPGLYLCQVNVIDDVAGSFSFPRLPLLIRESAPSKPAERGDSK